MTKVPDGARGWKGLQARLPGEVSDTTLRQWSRRGIIPMPLQSSPGGAVLWTEPMVQEALANLREIGRGRLPRPPEEE